jgi:predicted acylesterase/phospholipase RssA
MDGRSLVDGGLMDNLPLDVLAERCRGSLIAVDAFPYGDPDLAEPTGIARRWLRRVRARFHTDTTLTLFDILISSTFVGSQYRQAATAAQLKRVEYLALPLAGFGVLRWRAYRELFDAGYEYTRRRLKESFPHIPVGTEAHAPNVPPTARI